MPDTQNHLGISVLPVTPLAFKAPRFFSRTHEYVLEKLAPSGTGRHVGRDYLAAGVVSIMDAQVTLQSRCRRGTCSRSLAGLLDSQMRPDMSALHR